MLKSRVPFGLIFPLLHRFFAIVYNSAHAQNHTSQSRTSIVDPSTHAKATNTPASHRQFYNVSTTLLNMRQAFTINT